MLHLISWYLAQCYNGIRLNRIVWYKKLHIHMSVPCYIEGLVYICCSLNIMENGYLGHIIFRGTSGEICCLGGRHYNTWSSNITTDIISIHKYITIWWYKHAQYFRKTVNGVLQYIPRIMHLVHRLLWFKYQSIWPIFFRVSSLTLSGPCKRSKMYWTLHFWVELFNLAW